MVSMLFAIGVVTASLIIQSINGQVITTVAGNGSSTTSGNGFPAISAGVPSPTDVAVDVSGNIYISSNNNIRRITSDGVINPFAVVPIPQFSLQTRNEGIEYYRDSIYVVQRSSGTRVMRILQDGTAAVFVQPGMLGATNSQAFFGQFSDVVFDPLGNVYIADTVLHRVVRRAPGATTLSVFAGRTNLQGFGGDGGLATAALLNMPSGLAIDADGNLYISDSGNHRIRRVDKDGVITTIAGSGGPGGGFAGDGGPASNAQLNWPGSIVIDRVGNLYIADGGSRELFTFIEGRPTRVRKVDRTGAITTVVGCSSTCSPSDNGPATSVRLEGVSGIAVDQSGTLYIADTNAHKVRKVTFDNAAPPPLPRPMLMVSPPSLSFSTNLDKATSNQIISVLSGDVNIAFGAKAVTDSGTSWLSVGPTTGTTPADLTIEVSPVTTAGVYTGYIEITAADAENSPQRIPVTYTVNEEQPITIFLVHGIGQDGGQDGDLSRLTATLRNLLNSERFVLDAGFDFRHCANRTDCDSACTIGGTENTSSTNGARVLGAYINNRSPKGAVVIVGFSMGGLIARDMIVNGFSRHAVTALITLGTPHLGYPYESLDASGFLGFGRCGPLAHQMFGDFRNPPSSEQYRSFQDKLGNHVVTLSPYLHNLNTLWSSAPSSRLPSRWYTVAGTFCSEDIRTLSERGCSSGTTNDGVVCRQSASFDLETPNTPTERWQDPLHRYAHREGKLSLFCHDITIEPLPSLGSPPPYGLSTPDSDPDGQVLFKLVDWFTGLR